MTGQQKKLLATIVAGMLVTFGLPSAIISWSIAHRVENATASSNLDSDTISPSFTPTEPVSNCSTSPGSDISVTAEQCDLALRTVEAFVTWAQEESPAVRIERLSSVLPPEIAATPSFWETGYGSVRGAYATVEKMSAPKPSYQSESAIELIVLVTYTLHLPKGNGNFEIISGESNWTVEVPISVHAGSRALNVREPNAA